MRIDASDKAKTQEIVKDLCENVLVNPVTEDYEFEIMENKHEVCDKVYRNQRDGDCYHICKNILGQPTENVFHKETFAPQDFDLIILPGASHGDYLRPEPGCPFESHELIIDVPKPKSAYWV